MFIELLQFIVWLDTCHKGMPYKIIRFVQHQQDNFCLKERTFQIYFEIESRTYFNLPNNGKRLIKKD